MSPRYSYEPIAAYLGGTPGTQAELLGVDRRQIYRWQERGLTRDQAERVAEGFRLHPLELWPEMVSEVERACAECEGLFVPLRSNHKFCSTSCKHRCLQREWQRRRYAEDPEFRARRLAEAARYHVEVREYRRAYRRQWDRANREQINARRRERNAAARDGRERVRQGVDYKDVNLPTGPRSEASLMARSSRRRSASGPESGRDRALDGSNPASEVSRAPVTMEESQERRGVA